MSEELNDEEPSLPPPAPRSLKQNLQQNLDNLRTFAEVVALFTGEAATTLEQIIDLKENNPPDSNTSNL